jgi:hypothetical protein
MTIPLALIESDVWPSIRHKIQAERERLVEGLLGATPESLRGQQQFIAALDWVVEQAMPKPADNEKGIYEDDD